MAGARRISRDPLINNQDHYCVKEKVIQEMYEDIHGNGKEGIKTTIKLVSQTVGVILKSVDELHTKYDLSIQESQRVKSAFEQYRSEMMGVEKQQAKIDLLEEKRMVHKRWIVGLIITVILTITGLIFTGIKLIQDNSIINAPNTTISK